MWRFLALYCLVFVLLPSLAAQESTWVAVSRPHLDQGQYELSLGLLSHKNKDLQYLALGQLEEAIKLGQTGANDPNLFNLLKVVSIGMWTTTVLPESKSINRQVEVRLQALSLLVLCGGEAAIDLLAQIIALEKDATVLGEAWRSWALLEAEPKQETTLHLTRHLSDNFPHGPHNDLMNNICLVIEKYYQRGKKIASDELFESLFRLSQNYSYLKQTRDRAMNLIRSISGLPPLSQ